MRILILRHRLSLTLTLLTAGCGETSSTVDSKAGPPSLAPTMETKAAMELGTARTLEKSRKTKQAETAYRRIIQEYPDSPQARIATERLGVLGSK